MEIRVENNDSQCLGVVGFHYKNEVSLLEKSSGKEILVCLVSQKRASDEKIYYYLTIVSFPSAYGIRIFYFHPIDITVTSISVQDHRLRMNFVPTFLKLITVSFTYSSDDTGSV